MKKTILFFIFAIFTAGYFLISAESALAQIAAPTPRVKAVFETSTTIVGTGENPGEPTFDEPTSITFQGGEAYLTTGDGCRANCPKVNKGDTATIKVEIFLNTNEFNRNIKNVRAVMQINTIFFSNIKANGNPEIVSIPTLNDYYLYKWKLSNPNTGQNHYTFTVTGIVQSNSGETNVVLTMSGVTIVDNNLGDLYAGATSLPTDNNCNKYGGIMKDIKTDFPTLSATNYGDPVCSYTPAKFRKVIEETENIRDNWDFWNDIADCESQSPNGYKKNGAGGTWGKFQMRRSFPNPFKPWTEEDDRGDVTWQKQVINAVSYNNSLKAQGDNFGYWGTARCFCYYNKYKNGSYCKDIIGKGNLRTPNSGKCSVCTINKGLR